MALAARLDPFFTPPLGAQTNGFQRSLQLFVHPLVRVSLGILPVDSLAEKKVLQKGSAGISFPGTVILQRFLRAGGAVLAFWRAPAAGEDFRIGGEARCRADGVRRLRDGDLVRLDGRQQSYIIEHAEGDLVVLQAEMLVDRGPLLVEYDADSHLPVAASSTNDAASRSQMLASFLGQLGRTRDRDALAQLSTDPSFFVRWHAMREWLVSDLAGAMPRLQAMAAADPHPEIRQAAASLAAALLATINEEDR